MYYKGCVRVQERVPVGFRLEGSKRVLLWVLV